jgi:hypothetical protein
MSRDGSHDGEGEMYPFSNVNMVRRREVTIPTIKAEMLEATKLEVKSLEMKMECMKKEEAMAKEDVVLDDYFMRTRYRKGEVDGSVRRSRLGLVNENKEMVRKLEGKMTKLKRSWDEARGEVTRLENEIEGMNMSALTEAYEIHYWKGFEAGKVVGLKGYPELELSEEDQERVDAVRRSVRQKALGRK